MYQLPEGKQDRGIKTCLFDFLHINALSADSYEGHQNSRRILWREMRHSIVLVAKSHLTAGEKLHSIN